MQYFLGVFSVKWPEKVQFFISLIIEKKCTGQYWQKLFWKIALDKSEQTTLMYKCSATLVTSIQKFANRIYEKSRNIKPNLWNSTFTRTLRVTQHVCQK